MTLRIPSEGMIYKTQENELAKTSAAEDQWAFLLINLVTSIQVFKHLCTFTRGRRPMPGIGGWTKWPVTNVYLPLAVNGKQTCGQCLTVKIRMLLLRITNLMDCLNLFSKYLFSKIENHEKESHQKQDVENMEVILPQLLPYLGVSPTWCDFVFSLFLWPLQCLFFYYQRVVATFGLSSNAQCIMMLQNPIYCHFRIAGFGASKKMAHMQSSMPMDEAPLYTVKQNVSILCIYECS